MSKGKSVFVTSIMTIMMAVITVAAYRLYPTLFMGIAIAFSVIGFIATMSAFCNWLEKAPRRVNTMQPPEVSKPQYDSMDYQIMYGYDYDAEH